MAHKYLNDIGIKSDECYVFNTLEKGGDRDELFAAQREKYGFDERETWSLDATLISWLYSHLKMYKDTNCVDLTFHKFDIPVLHDIPKDEWELSGVYPAACQKEVIENHTEEEAIDIAIDYMEKYLTSAFCHEPEDEVRGYECATCSLRIIAEIFGALWW